MTLDPDLMTKVHRNELSPKVAFAAQAVRDAGGGSGGPYSLSDTHRSSLRNLHSSVIGQWLRGHMSTDDLRRRWHSRLPWEIGPDGLPHSLDEEERHRRLALPWTKDPETLRRIADAAQHTGGGLPDLYRAAAAWIRRSGSSCLRQMLAAHEAVWEPDPGPKPCVQERRRREVLALAVAEGFVDDDGTSPSFEDGPKMVSVSADGLPAASLAIRALSGSATHAYVVGKGPSLDLLSADDFPHASDPVIALNEAIHAVESIGLRNPVFCLQQDAGLGTRCRPDRAVWLLSSQAWTAAAGDSYPRSVRCVPDHGGGRARSLSCNMALRYLSRAGFGSATMLAFDACTRQDTGYALSIGEVPQVRRKDDGSRFLGHCREIAKVGSETGIACQWRDPIRMWCVVCVLRSGGQYSARHVAWLRRQVDARVRTPHRFVCLTDVAGIPDGLPLQHDWSGWWSKIELFRPGVFPTGAPILYMDLDVVLCNDIDLPDPNELPDAGVMAPSDWWRTGERNSSVMLWRAGAADEAYTSFVSAPDAAIAATPHGDQAWVSNHIRTVDASLRIRSWKAHRLADTGPGDTQIAVFHGRPKPWDVDAAWVPPLTDQDHAPSGRARWLSRTILQRGYLSYVEVGVKDGRTVAWVAASCPDVSIWAVDRFAPQPGNAGPEDYVDWDWDGIRAQYSAATRPYGDRIRTIVADACDAAALVDGPVDFVFLAADHGEEQTGAAIATWRTHVRPGGIIAGHDYDWKTVRAAVDASFGVSVVKGEDHVWWVEL